MRIFRVLFNHKPQNPNKVKLKTPTHAFELRPYISGRSTVSQERTGITAILALLTSMKNHDFNDEMCKPEADNLRTTMKESYLQYLKAKEIRRSGKIHPGENLTGPQLNKYLKRFPEPKKKPL